ncbi:MAG: hypothetical protein IKB38_08545 [Clostridia bacterium]|nr:hypothetical protein [Clostridia bacterium]
MKKSSSKAMSAAQKVALVGIMAATVECGKLVLAAVPNVEVVTLLLAIYGYAFGWLGILAAVVFVCIEPVIWGFGSWMVSYFIYWPLVAFVFLMLGRARVKNRFVLALIAVSLSALFGVLTSLVDVGLFMGRFDNFVYRFSILYMRGVPFYLTQIICNAVLFLTVFPFLSKKLLHFAKRK